MSLCPYPGLRPFSEDEAIYFQGREENVATIATVLEQNRFLMLAGSSGDGKSSLVFAGLVPHCRAGFFKAAYPGWAVATFRPERAPLQNLAAALADALGLEAAPVEGTLRHGFSALADLYLSSAAVCGVADGAPAKAQLAASQNLLIVADQFEELFTNPENFVNGAPSAEARLCVNLLLETARLALAQDLPIYIVCTMRSDYIGQCNAFAGLPEMIGFSHYFVPRLTRTQLRRVILEPARLNGDQIAPRLAERLIYDLDEGEDQLPLLQHALAAVWRAAEAMGQPLDLAAYHRCGGMAANDLPAQDKPAAQAYDAANPRATDVDDAAPYGLGAVLNRHADDLYQAAIAAETDSQAAWLLERAFCCLTGVDRGRMVRNRMSLRQMAETLEADPAAQATSLQTIDRMLAHYRSMAAGFLRPLQEEGDAATLPPDAVLDITHEALIRNWVRLRAWTLAEHRRAETWAELAPQVRRWEQSARRGRRLLGGSSTYLLQIGPLGYFESWLAETRPTPRWLLRYANPDEHTTDATPTEAAALTQASTNLAVVDRYIRTSAKRLASTRYVMRVGAGKLALRLVAVCALISGCIFGWVLYTRTNGYVYEKMQKEAIDLLKNPYVDQKVKGRYIIDFGLANDRLQMMALIKDNASDSLRAKLAAATVERLCELDKEALHPWIKPLLYYADSCVKVMHEENTEQKIGKLYLLNRIALYYQYVYQRTGDTTLLNPSVKIGKLISKEFYYLLGCKDIVNVSGDIFLISGIHSVVLQKKEDRQEAASIMLQLLYILQTTSEDFERFIDGSDMKYGRQVTNRPKLVKELIQRLKIIANNIDNKKIDELIIGEDEGMDYDHTNNASFFCEFRPYSNYEIRNGAALDTVFTKTLININYRISDISNLQSENSSSLVGMSTLKERYNNFITYYASILNQNYSGDELNLRLGSLQKIAMEEFGKESHAIWNESLNKAIMYFNLISVDFEDKFTNRYVSIHERNLKLGTPSVERKNIVSSKYYYIGNYRNYLTKNISDGWLIFSYLNFLPYANKLWETKRWSKYVDRKNLHGLINNTLLDYNDDQAFDAENTFQNALSREFPSRPNSQKELISNLAKKINIKNRISSTKSEGNKLITWHKYLENSLYMILNNSLSPYISSEEIMQWFKGERNYLNKIYIASYMIDENTKSESDSLEKYIQALNHEISNNYSKLGLMQNKYASTKYSGLAFISSNEILYSYCVKFNPKLANKLQRDLPDIIDPNKIVNYGMLACRAHIDMGRYYEAVANIPNYINATLRLQNFTYIIEHELRKKFIPSDDKFYNSILVRHTIEGQNDIYDGILFE